MLKCYPGSVINDHYKLNLQYTRTFYVDLSKNHYFVLSKSDMLLTPFSILFHCHLFHCQFDSAATAAKDAGIRIIAFGVTNNVDEEELRLISSEPQEFGVSYYLAANFSDFERFTDTITDRICYEIQGMYYIRCWEISYLKQLICFRNIH